MIYEYGSGLANDMHAFMAQKNALGFPYASGAYILSCFDKMCRDAFPAAAMLSKEICDFWGRKKPNENANAFRNRLSVVREFGKYLNRNGVRAYVIPPNLAKKDAKQIPYIYTTEEISAIWQEFDELKPTKCSPARHLVFPAIIRMLYCCGLRPCEARKLEAADVDLAASRLFIRESKGRKDRIVMMAGSVAVYMRDYNERAGVFMPGRKYFFSNPSGGIYDASRLNAIFIKIRKKLGIYGTDICKPKLYGFRHSFATHRLYQWLKEGSELDSMMPYLSAYMGHAQVTDTYYYIHLVPEQFEAMSGVDFGRYENLLPEVECDE